jgi:hypothetical protein
MHREHLRLMAQQTWPAVLVECWLTSDGMQGAPHSLSDVLSQDFAINLAKTEVGRQGAASPDPHRDGGGRSRSNKGATLQQSMWGRQSRSRPHFATH